MRFPPASSEHERGGPPSQRPSRQQREGEDADGHGADGEEPPALDGERVTGREPERAVQAAFGRRLVLHHHERDGADLGVRDMWLGRPTQAKAGTALFSSS
jgi:hypothetical protein